MLHPSPSPSRNFNLTVISFFWSILSSRNSQELKFRLVARPEGAEESHFRSPKTSLGRRLFCLRATSFATYHDKFFLLGLKRSISLWVSFSSQFHTALNPQGPPPIHRLTLRSLFGTGLWLVSRALEGRSDFWFQYPPHLLSNHLAHLMHSFGLFRVWRDSESDIFDFDGGDRSLTLAERCWRKCTHVGLFIKHGSGSKDHKITGSIEAIYPLCVVLLRTEPG